MKDIKPEPLVTGVLATHPDVVSHQPYTSLRDVQIKEEKREKRERGEEKERSKVEVKEFWKPHAASGSTNFFTEGGFEYVLSNPSPSRRAEIVSLDELWYSSLALYSYSDLRSAVNKYVDARQLTNPRDRSYVHVRTDDVLSMVCAKGEVPERFEFLKREDIVQRLSKKMQSWYEVQAEGKDPVLKYVRFWVVHCVAGGLMGCR